MRSGTFFDSTLQGDQDDDTTIQASFTYRLTDPAQMNDSNGVTIPLGVQVRPFSPPSSTTPPTTTTPMSQASWYFDQFLWAQRILPDAR